MNDAAVKVDLAKLAPSPQSQPRAGGQATATLIAYSYTYSLEAPAPAIPALLRRHQAECVEAGPAVCQLLDSELTVNGADTLANLNMRAAPNWLAKLRNSLESDARGVGGRVAQTDTSAEDLTRSIIDTQAGVRAQTTLRDRLQTLLATRPGKLDELINLEKELALVQGQLDATTSELAVLNGRVQMSKLTISYTTPTRERMSAATPLVAALGGFGAAAASSLAALITLLAVLLPWALLLSVATMVGFAVRRRRKWLKPRT